jgi:type III pantothenate kinase
MFLAIDIGNTNIKFALFKAKRIFRRFRVTTDKNMSFRQYEKILQKTFVRAKVKDTQIDQVIICSVVPKLTTIFKIVLLSLLKKKPLILGQDVVVPIKNLYRDPKQVGQDRLANALAVFSKYRGPIVIVDFGTALTFDVVSEEGDYLGGIIVPGMQISFNNLIRNADLLPEVDLKKPRVFLGRETIASMRSGLVYGYSFLVEGILTKFKQLLGKRPFVVATGGEAALMSNYCKSIHKIDKDLTLKGIMIAFHIKNKQKS